MHIVTNYSSALNLSGGNENRDIPFKYQTYVHICVVLYLIYC